MKIFVAYPYALAGYREALAQSLSAPDFELVYADEHLADQLLLPLALGGGSFSTTKLSNHSCTNMMVIKAFLNTGFELEEQMDDQTCEVSVSTRS